MVPITRIELLDDAIQTRLRLECCGGFRDAIVEMKGNPAPPDVKPEQIEGGEPAVGLSGTAPSPRLLRRFRR